MTLPAAKGSRLPRREPRSLCIARAQERRRGQGPPPVQAALRAGTRHLVYISVVGAERIPMTSGIDRAMFGYFGSKLAAERTVADSGLPWTTLRATQFHDLILMAVERMAKLPVIPVPAGLRFQPIDAGEVADRLVEPALDTPAGLVPEIAGPRVYELTELVRGYLRARSKRRPIMPIWLQVMPPAHSGRAETSPRSGAVGRPDMGGLRGHTGVVASRHLTEGH